MEAFSAQTASLPQMEFSSQGLAMKTVESALLQSPMASELEASSFSS
jgi:hypothetical protein